MKSIHGKLVDNGKIYITETKVFKHYKTSKFNDVTSQYNGITLPLTSKPKITRTSKRYKKEDTIRRKLNYKLEQDKLNKK